MKKTGGFLSILIPSITVFFSSACIMILELVASRLIARHLGSSLYTWTSVIGVVLAGIAIGNWLGGRIADRFAARKALAVLFMASSIACVVIVILNNVVGKWILLWQFSWPLRVFSHVALVFLAPSTLLGTISPVVAKMALDKGLPTGRTVGDIYAWGAAGSIAGTFLAGFYLIAAMGTIAIIWTTGAALLLMAILYWAKLWVLYIWAAIFIALMTMGMAPYQWAQNAGPAVGLRRKLNPDILYENETQYCYVAVEQVSKRPDERIFRQDKLTHSQIVMGDLNNLQYFYTHIYAGIIHGLSKDKDKLSVMVIGGGGYAFPQYLEQKFPDSRIDIVEIDPGVTEAAMQAFGLSRDTTINTITMDARNYVDELFEKRNRGEEIPQYDFVYEDAINDFSVPFQLVTKEFNEKIAQILTEDGVYMINLIDTYNNASFLGAVVNTIRETFGYVYVITNYVSLPILRDTYVIVASNQPVDTNTVLAEYNPNLKFRYFDETDMDYIREKSGEVILTDDYAPVENMLAPVVRQSAKEFLARKYVDKAKKFKRRQEWQKSIARFQQALELNPSISILAYNEIGLIHAGQGNMEQAADALQKAIDYYYDTDTAQDIIGTIHLNLGTLYQGMGKSEQAAGQFTEAIGQFRIELKANPKDITLWDRLGDTLASIGDFKSASQAFKKALDLEPANPARYAKLANVLEYDGQYDKAIEVLQKGVMYMSNQNQTENAARLLKTIEILRFKKSRQQK